EQANLAVQRLRAIVADDCINVLTPAGPNELAKTTTAETEQPGTGSATGGVIGGAAGAAVGLSIETAGAGLVMPGRRRVSNWACGGKVFECCECGGRRRCGKIARGFYGLRNPNRRTVFI